MMTYAANSALALGTSEQVAPRLTVAKTRVMRPKVIPRILLVDDDPLFGKVMHRAAACLHAPLTFVRSLSELAETQLGAFDVAILDYDLGAITGLELTNYLDHRVQMPIVLISGDVRRPDRKWSDSIHDFMLKTCGPFAIIDAAFEAHEIARIHRSMRTAKGSTQRPSH